MLNNLIHNDTPIAYVNITIYAIPDDDGSKDMISFRDIDYSKLNFYQAHNVTYKDVLKVYNSIIHYCNHRDIKLKPIISYQFNKDKIDWLYIDLDSNMMSMSNNDW